MTDSSANTEGSTDEEPSPIAKPNGGNSLDKSNDRRTPLFNVDENIVINSFSLRDIRESDSESDESD